MSALQSSQDDITATLGYDFRETQLIFGERHLRRVLKSYCLYYNETRTHLGLDKDSPYPAPFSERGPSRPSRFYPDCITATRGYDIREGHPVQLPSR